MIVDENAGRMLLDIEAGIEPEDPLRPCSEAEADEMLKGLDGVGEEGPLPQAVQNLGEAARAYELKRDRLQLVSYLERAYALAEKLDEAMASYIRRALAHLRE